MANTAITKTLREETTADINRLLGRGRLVFKCPLSDEDQVEFWHNMLPRDVVEAYGKLKAHNYDPSSMSSNSVRMVTEIENKKYLVRFVQQGASDFLSKDRYGNKFVRRDVNTMINAMPTEKWEPFKDWIENCAIIDRDFAPALVTLAEVLKFCGTVGQLTRAIPDLYKYLPSEKQELLRAQTRASNMPHEWHVFDRSRIENLQFAMAKASLLPHTRHQFHEIKGTGAHYFAE